MRVRHPVSTDSVFLWNWGVSSCEDTHAYAVYHMCLSVLSMYMYMYMFMYPLTEKIRLTIFGSRDLTIFSLDILGDGDSVYARENLHENLGTPVETCLICKGTHVKTC